MEVEAGLWVNGSSFTLLSALVSSVKSFGKL